MESVIQSVPLAQIVPNPCLRTRSETEVETMANSLGEIGQISPIGVIRSKNGYEIVHGNTRYFAAEKLGWEAIEARIYAPETSAAECMQLAVCENTVREQMNFVEMADALHEYAKLCSLTLAQAGLKLNFKQSQISKCLKTDERLSPRNKKLLLDAGIGGSLAYLISQEQKLQDQLVDAVIAENWSRKQLEQHFRNKRQGKVKFEFRHLGAKLVLEVQRNTSFENVLALLKQFAGTLKRNSGFDLTTAARRIKEQANVLS